MAPEQGDCLQIGIVPITERPSQHLAQSHQAIVHAAIGTNNVGSMLAIEDRGLFVVGNLTTAAGHQNVGPPVVGDDARVFRGLSEQVTCGVVEQHGIAAGDALYKRVLEARRLAEQGGSPYRCSIGIDQQRTRAV
ncbi:hypothetical protein D3C81_1435060 [compost metagenome]